MRTYAVAAPPAAQLVTWEQASKAVSHVLNGYTVRGSSAKPRTAPGSVLPASPHPRSSKEVVLYRDTNSWCPFCERVWWALEEKGIAFDTMFIDLRAKPAWFLEMVPTGLVPAAWVRGRLVYESKDILLALEEAFPERPLLPADEAQRAAALEAVAALEGLTPAGYKVLGAARARAGAAPEPAASNAATSTTATSSGGGSGGGNSAPTAGSEVARAREAEGQGAAQEAAAGAGAPAADGLEAAIAEFEGQLAVLEGLLERSGGPFVMGQLGLADVMLAPGLIRLAANMPMAAGYELRRRPDLPRLAAWFVAVDAQPAYQRVRSDDETLQLIIRKLLGVPRVAHPSWAAADATTTAARREAAAKMAANAAAIRDDILRNSGIMRSRTNLYGGTTASVNAYPPEPSPRMVDAVDYALRRVVQQLLTGAPGPRHPHLEAAALGSAALACFRSRASAPRDLSAAAAQQLRAACTAVLQDMY